jgi:phosphoserine phosphatase RsbU/P
VVENPSAPSPLADLLLARRDAVVTRWTARVQVELGERFSRAELINSMPDFVDALIASLRAGERLPPIPARPVAEIGETHGAQRARLPVDLRQVVLEYGLVRDVVFELAEAEGLPISPRELRVLTSAIGDGIAAAADRFARERAAAADDAEQRFRAFADHAPAPLFIKAANGRFLFVNRFMAGLLGRPIGEIVGHSDAELLPAATAAQLAAGDARALAGETVELQESVPGPDGPRSFVTVKFPLHGEPGGPAMGGIALDVTELQRAQAEARRAQQLLELGDAFFELDRDWRMLRVNANQERLSGKPRRETLGRVLWELWPEIADPASPYWQEYHRAMDERIPREFDAYYAPLDMWTNVTVYPIADGGITVFFRDVTARKRDEERLRQAGALEQQLIGIVSHDLRNPLNAILLGASAVLAREGLSERDTAAVARIRSSAERAARMIRDLLDVTRARLGGGIPVSPRETDLHAVARTAVEETAVTSPDREIHLVDGAPAVGRWDPDRLAQAIANLLSNAVQYGAPRTPITVRVGTSPGEAFVSVHSEGPPIPPEVQASIFDPWERGDHGAAPGGPAQNAGLGLYIVERIAAAHGGRVAVESTPGRGTTFTLRLPRA